MQSATAAINPEFGPLDDLRAFRSALGTFATGVTVVTTSADGVPAGITANSFASVSLDPPLVLWCPALASRRFALFAAAQDFAIHVLAADQYGIAEGFTRSAQAFDGLDWTRDQAGVPLLDGVAARFRCRLHAVHPAGDHAIIIGLVESAMMTERAPLVFQGGRFGGFRDPH